MILTYQEALIIRLIEDGRTRRRIAQIAGLYEDDVRAIIADLCERYDCRTGDLPAEAADDIERKVSYP